MTTTIKCNFSEVFAKFNSVNEVNDIANAVRSELINAYNARIKELGGNKKSDLSVSVSTEGTKKAEKPAKKGTKKSETKKSETKAETKKSEKKSETKKAAEKKSTKKSEKKAKKERTYKVEQIALTDTKAVKKLGLKFIPYSDKCFILGGNTEPIAQELRGMKKLGVFGNGHLKPVKGFEGGFGWLVNKENENYAKVCKSLGLKKA